MGRRATRPVGHHSRMGEDGTVRARYEAALDELVEDLQRDRQVLAVALFGSLAYDVVWERSDIDVLIVVTERPGSDPGRGALCYGGVNVHAAFATREQFKKVFTGAAAGSRWQSMNETSRLLFSRDATIDALFDEARGLGARDRGIALMREACFLVPSLTKAQKWLYAKGDLDYASLWTLFAVDRVAAMVVIRAGLAPNREVILQALDVEPELIGSIYHDLLSKKKTKALVADRIARIDGYLTEHQQELFGPLLEYLGERREPVSAADIDHYFARRFDVSLAIAACEYLADNKLIEKTSLPVKLTRKSKVEVEGLAFMYLPDVL